MLPVWACAVMPDHVHLVVAASPMTIKQRVIQLKASATRVLCDRGVHPFQTADGSLPPKCFAQGEWKVYLDESWEVDRAVVYVERNPEKEGLHPQRWDFVTDWRREIVEIAPLREDE